MFHHSNHTQAITNSPRAAKHSNHALSRLTPRSGWRVSLRRDGLVQASPLRLGEGSKTKTGTNAGSRLGETPLAWARCSLAQKAELVAWATFRTKVLGESLLISPRRDWLAWARLTGLATVLLSQ